MSYIKSGVPWFESWAGLLRVCLGSCRVGCMRIFAKKGAERLVEMDLPGYAIGGLAVGEPREVTREMIARTLEHLPTDKPRYVMGVGYPDEIEEYARMGVDMMDCVCCRQGRGGMGCCLRRRAASTLRRRSMRRIRGQSMLGVGAWCASGIRGLICGICLRRGSR